MALIEKDLFHKGIRFSEIFQSQTLVIILTVFIFWPSLSSSQQKRALEKSLTPKAQSFISQQGETIHLELSGQAQWDYQLNKLDLPNKNVSFQLLVPTLSSADIQDLKSFKHPLLEKIEIDSAGPDGQTIVTFFPKYKNLEAFDYLTEKPSRLIVDFFMATPEKGSEKNSSTLENKTADTKPPKNLEKKSQPVAKESGSKKTEDETEESNVAKPLRNPATADYLVLNEKGMPVPSVDVGDISQIKKISTQPMGSVFDGGDPNFDRFNIKDYEIREEAIIASQEKVYIDFPMLKIPSPYLEILKSRKPLYEISSEDNEENKQARLLLTLFENKRYNVFLKTFDWFVAKFPQSKYDEMLQFMRADAHYAQWEEKKNADDFDQAMLRYRQAIEKYPESPLLERTMMLIGFSTLDRGDYLSTLRLFLTHIQKRPQSPNKDIAKFAMAEAFSKIKKYDEAAQIYRELEKEASAEKDKIQASYRLGDIAFEKKDFRQALQDYQAAIKKHPQGKSEYPNAIYNQATAYFNLKEYRNSLDQYREFIKNFSTNSEAGYAMTRIGEILDILGAKPERVVGTYLETFFRYGNAPSSVVARLRMLSERMDKMKDKEVEKAVTDIQKLSGESNLPKMDQFATLMISEGYNRRKNYPVAIDLLIKFYQANPTTVDTQLFKSRIVKNINEMIKDDVEKGRFISALQTHNKYADNWLKGSNRIDTLFAIANAYEQGGALKDSEKVYTEALNKILALKGTRAAKERSIFEKLPSEDEVLLRLAAVQAQRGEFPAAMNSVKDIKEPAKLSDREQIERIQIISSLLEKKGDSESALRYVTELVKEWSGVPELVADPYLTLAQLELKTGKRDDAIKSLKKIDQMMEDSQKVPVEVHFRSTKMLADIYLDKKDTEKIVPQIEKLLSNYSATKPLSSYRYKLGKIYFDKGELKKAEEVWSELKGKDSSTWAKLAEENLKDVKWKDEYNKYIKRIPAMSSEPGNAERKNQ